MKTKSRQPHTGVEGYMGYRSDCGTCVSSHSRSQTVVFSTEGAKYLDCLVSGNSRRLRSCWILCDHKSLLGCLFQGRG